MPEIKKLIETENYDLSARKSNISIKQLFKMLSLGANARPYS